MVGEELTRLVELTAHLRGPDGCPWDRAQDYDSVKGLLLEEAYEVIDAVNARDFDAIEDELGDLLFQVVFYSRLAEEERCFTLEDVAKRVHAKLVRRHPHVFGEARAANAEEALKSWLSVKEKERAAKSEAANSGSSPGSGTSLSLSPGIQPPSLLDNIPRTLPSTLEAHEIGTRVAEVGFDWDSVGDVLDKVEEEVRELRQELKASDKWQVTSDERTTRRPLRGPCHSSPVTRHWFLCSSPKSSAPWLRPARIPAWKARSC